MSVTLRGVVRVGIGRFGPGLVVAGMAFMGCASPRPPAPFRDATAEEQARLTGVLLPLLQAAQINVPPGCVVRLGIVPDPQVNVSVAIRQEPRCPQTVALLITEGALNELSSGELRGLLAHQLGHLGRNHGPPTPYSVDQERQADQVAMVLLLRVGGKDHCRGLAGALARVADLGANSRAWRTAHPAPRDQAAAVRQACEASPRESARASPIRSLPSHIIPRASQRGTLATRARIRMSDSIMRGHRAWAWLNSSPSLAK
jgi:hypothetical protein